jgi:hypothetical protein
MADLATELKSGTARGSPRLPGGQMWHKKGEVRRGNGVHTGANPSAAAAHGALCIKLCGMSAIGVASSYVRLVGHFSSSYACVPIDQDVYCLFSTQAKILFFFCFVEKNVKNSFLSF